MNQKTKEFIARWNEWILCWIRPRKIQV